MSSLRSKRCWFAGVEEEEIEDACADLFPTGRHLRVLEHFDGFKCCNGLRSDRHTEAPRYFKKITSEAAGKKTWKQSVFFPLVCTKGRSIFTLISKRPVFTASSITKRLQQRSLCIQQTVVHQEASSTVMARHVSLPRPTGPRVRSALV